MKAQTLWSLPSGQAGSIITLQLLLLASLACQRAISIDSDQPAASSASSTKSEINPTPTTTTTTTATSTSTQTTPNAQQMIKPASGQQVASWPQASVSAAKKSPPTSTRSAGAQNNGRVRKPTQQATSSSIKPTHANQNQQQELAAGSAPAAQDDWLQEDIKRLVAEYSNTPPLFVTSTRDFFVDVARYPLGFKLATMQAIDSEGDRIEYSLKPANYRDASPYFSINATSGELRLANRRIPVQAEPTVASPEVVTTTLLPLAPSETGANSDELEDESGDGERASEWPANEALVGARQLAKRVAQQEEASFEKPSHLYFLNVAASDGRYSSIVELQIHVFNSSSFGTKSPVQLTIENGRRGAESLMRNKTNEFISKLYHPSASSAASQQAYNNSTLVFPSFVNPTLVAPTQVGHDELASAGAGGFTTPSGLAPVSHNELTTFANSEFVAPNPSAALVVESNSRFDHAHTGRASAMMDGNLMQQQQQQQSMVLNFVIVVCSCFTLALLLIIFVVPLSVKRLKKRLKNMELQHEQLSQKASSVASSMLCSSANSTHSAASMTISGRLPSLSQFTLSGSDRSCAMSQLPDSTLSHSGRALGRQSSLDSAIASSALAGATNFAATNSSLSYQTQRYYPPQHQTHSISGNHHEQQFNQHFIINQHQHQHQQQQQQQILMQQQLTNNGLNRINNGAIVNPVYLHGQSASSVQLEQQQQQQRQASDLNNIYCPIDDDFYSTINNELDPGNQPQATGATATTSSAMIVGQTCESRNYFASQCAPSQQQQQRRVYQHHIAISAAANQQLQQQQQQQQQRDTETPVSRSSSRSSTRSLARFLSLPARHWSHQASQQPEAELEARKRKSSFLDELESQLVWDSQELAGDSKAPKPSELAKTIARANHIAQEQQVRLGKRARKQQQQQQQQQQAEHQWELERHQLKFIDILDEGQFGLVWRCKLRAQLASESGTLAEQTVAVKTLKSFAARDERERQELLAEIEIMKLVCEHPNVVKMLHCCTRDVSQSKPILLVMEHVELGKLQSFLEKSRASHNYATTSSLYNHASESLRGLEYQEGADEEEAEEAASSVYNSASESGRLTSAMVAARQQREQLTSRELIKFIYHVAKGMEYISGQSIVHRDLASRNILISGQRVCKIGDFGMARHVANSCDVYERRSRNTKIPVRWMAPEVLLHNSFTTKSDVYSFGILMWEIVTLGSTPYASLKMEQIIEAVARQGQRPSKPDYCHALLYSIMSRCWSAAPEQRPTFGELVRQLDELLMSSNEYIELDQYPDHNYYNIAGAPGELV